jgi:hypothetical protein
MGLFNKSSSEREQEDINIKEWYGVVPTTTSNHTSNSWPQDYKSSSGTSTTAPFDPFIATDNIEASDSIAEKLAELEEKIEMLQAKIDNMKECPKCMRVTPRWSDDDHYLCDDCR